jgi:1,4-dihydroxy-2-naphthoyl-CoA hydrolase
MIWKNKIDLALLANFSNNTLSSHLGIEIIEVGDDYIKGTMPVDHRTKQPAGLLHGGASVVLSETLGSIASFIAAGEYGKYSCVGIEVNANHIKSAKSGVVTGITKPVKIGKTLHIWNTEIFDEAGDIICISRLTVMVKEIGN